VLIKQIDSLGRDGSLLAVIMITNRVTVLDPAVVRRAALQLRFVRPDGSGRSALFHRLLQGTGTKEREIGELVERSERNGTPYSYSDLTERVAKLALREAFTADEPLQASHFLKALQEVAPSPLIDGILPPGVQQQQ
jgi:SpoVK/Ycf46/Vps4 family AAA+-type ATPase